MNDLIDDVRMMLTLQAIRDGRAPVRRRFEVALAIAKGHADYSEEAGVQITAAGCQYLESLEREFATDPAAPERGRRRPDEPIPQRFRFRANAADQWRFGVCLPVGDGRSRWWHVRTQRGFAYFTEDPWEVLGHVIGDVDEFQWIDNDYGWHGDTTAAESVDFVTQTVHERAGLA